MAVVLMFVMGRRKFISTSWLSCSSSNVRTCPCHHLRGVELGIRCTDGVFYSYFKLKEQEVRFFSLCMLYAECG